MKVKKQISPQQFFLEGKDYIYGCSFRKADKTEQYLGKVSVYTPDEWKDMMKMEHKVVENIKLGDGEIEKAKEKLISYIEENLV